MEHGHFHDRGVFLVLYGFVPAPPEPSFPSASASVFGPVTAVAGGAGAAGGAEGADPFSALSEVVRRRGLSVGGAGGGGFDDFGGPEGDVAVMPMTPRIGAGQPKFVLYVWVGARAPRALLARWRLDVSKVSRRLPSFIFAVKTCMPSCVCVCVCVVVSIFITSRFFHIIPVLYACRRAG